MKQENLTLEERKKFNIKPFDVKEFMLKWNMQYPLDRWWREKHDVAFGSLQHKEASLVNMAFEFEEDKYFKKLQEDNDDDLQFTEEEEKQYNLTPLAKNAGKQVKMTKKEIDAEFDNINLDDFNEKV